MNPVNKEHKDPSEIDFTAPRLAWYKQKTWKRHQATVYWVDLQLAQRKGLKFYQTRSNAIILYDTLPAYCIPKVVVMESGEIKYENVYMSPRTPLKISFKDNWIKELDSEVAGSSKRLPTNPTKIKNPIIKNGETRGWTRIHPADRERYLVWSRGHQELKNGETCGWTTIQPELCASVC